MMEESVLLFFDRMPDVLPLYEAFEEKLRTEFEFLNIKVQKTQISFSNRYNFAFVSLPVRRVKGWPEICMIVTFGLNRKAEDERIAVATEPYPGRWTHHVLIERIDEIDEKLMGWIREAYQFSMTK